ncbi:MAG: cytochrome [Pseudonocardiales bacterium]|nr:cytochrome [Pseudonocardiales bacterium]
MISHQPKVEFDHHSHAHARDPIGSYRQLRDTSSIAWTDAHEGYWILSAYDTVFDAARNPAVFSSARIADDDRLSVLIPKREHELHIPIELDPPEFRKYRGVINRYMSPPAVSEVTGLVERHTTEFIDEVIEAGVCDFTDLIGIPAAITLDWLGLPTNLWRDYAKAFHVLLSEVPGSPSFDHTTREELPRLIDATRRTISARRAKPADDVISRLLDEDVDGRGLTDDEVFSIVDLLIAGGVSTVASLLSQTFVWLHDHPNVRRQLTDDPTLMDHAIEEFLRYFTPAQAVARTVAEDIEFHGCPIRKGDRVLLAWASANRDEQEFANPDEVDVTRWPNRHVAFGLGPHRCAGAHLARAIVRCTLLQVLERMPDYVVEVDALEHFPDQSVSVGFRSIPTSFTPGPRRSGERLGLTPTRQPAQD